MTPCTPTPPCLALLQVLEDAVQQLSAQLVEKETSIDVLQQLLEDDTHGEEPAGPGRMALFSELRQLRVQVRAWLGV